MAETYCGKRCAECASREELNCPGCKNGPGAWIHGDCEIARCCREKNHETCLSCSICYHCGSFSGRANFPKYRQQRQIAEQEAQKQLAKELPFLGKWLGILFWVMIAAEVFGLLANQTVAGWSAGVYTAGVVTVVLAELAQCGILLKLASAEEQYRRAGFLSLAATVLGAIAVFADHAQVFALLIAIAKLIIALAARYHTYHAHAYAVSSFGQARSAQWEAMWKWYIGATVALIAGTLAVFAASMLGAIVFIFATVIMLIVGIAELVILYGTAKDIRNCCAKYNL